MSWVVTVGPRPEDLWVIGKDRLTTLAPPVPTMRAQHILRPCPLDAEIVSHLHSPGGYPILYSTIFVFNVSKVNQTNFAKQRMTRPLLFLLPYTTTVISLFSVKMLPECTPLFRILRYQQMWLLKH